MKTFEKVSLIFLILVQFWWVQRGVADAGREGDFWGINPGATTETSPFDGDSNSGVFGTDNDGGRSDFGVVDALTVESVDGPQAKKVFPWMRQELPEKIDNLPSSAPEPSVYSSIPMNELIPELDQTSHRKAEINQKSFDRIFLWENEILDSTVKAEPNMNFGWSVKPELRKRGRKFGNGLNKQDY